MPKKTNTSKKKPQPTKEQVLKKQLSGLGWDTTDEDEIARRRLRAIQEQMTVKSLEPELEFFANYLVQSESGSAYRVEIRSLDENFRINSCECSDFDVNKLGTCKHIEAVLNKLQKKPKKKLTDATTNGGERIEIYLDKVDKEGVKILFPKNFNNKQLQDDLNPFFSSDGSLLADPVVAIPSIERTLTKLPTDLRQNVRFSYLIPDWLERQKLINNHEKERKRYLQDIAVGKRVKDFLKFPLYPYQQEGMMHLAFTARAMLADEMGLGKTVQAIAAAEVLKRLKKIESVLVIVPTSLKSEWEEQIQKFTDSSLKVVIGPRHDRLRAYQEKSFYYIVNYEQVRNDYAEIQDLLTPDLIILDEAQRIKNWKTQTANSVKRLNSPYIFVLTGTPLENRIDEVYSIMQVIDPYIFGSLFRFNRDFYMLDEKGKAYGVKNLEEFHRRLKPVMLRRRKKDVEGELPERTNNNYFVEMAEEQRKRYEEYNEQAAHLVAVSLKRPLTKEELEKLQMFLACMRMLCDSTYILDQKTRISPKIEELRNILEEILEDKQNKVIIFSEWEKMLQLVKEEAEELQVGFAWHTGTVRQKQRREEINRFKEDENCRLFLSTDSGSVGLNLQNANYVINMDLPWNPAKLEQRIARAWRKHQARSVNVINLITEDSIEHRMLTTLNLKQSLADSAIDGIGKESIDFNKEKSSFMDRLRNITGITTPPKEKKEKLPLEEAISAIEQIRQDLQAQNNEQVKFLDIIPTKNNRKTAVAIVNKKDENIKKKLSISIENTFQDKPDLEVLDMDTYQQLKKLEELGIININPAATSLFLNQKEMEERSKNQKQEQIEKAKKHYKEVEYKHKLANVLVSGGFLSEAIPHVKETLEKALMVLSILLSEEDFKGQIPFDFIESTLLKEKHINQGLFSLIMKLRENSGDTKFVQKDMELITKLVEDIPVKLNKKILS